MAIVKKHVKAIIQLRRAIESEWVEVDPILRVGEPALSTDVYKLKIGDGQSRWSELKYLNQDGVSSFNGLTGDITYIPPITSINGRTGDIVINEALEPLIGTIYEITPQQVATALSEGRNINIQVEHTFNLDDESMSTWLNFTFFNRAIDTQTNGENIDVVVSQTLVKYGNIAILFELTGGFLNGQEMPWYVFDEKIPTRQYVNNTITDMMPHYMSDLINDSGYISKYDNLILNCGTSTTVI